MTCCSSVAARPPCSAGQPRPVQPAAARCRFQASRPSGSSCSRPGPPAPRRPAKSPVRLASSHSRTSERNSSSCAVNRTRALLPDWLPGRQRPSVRRLNLPSTCLLAGGALELTVPAVVTWAAREFGEAEALAVPGGLRLSYAELEE